MKRLRLDRDRQITQRHGTTFIQRKLMTSYIRRMSAWIRAWRAKDRENYFVSKPTVYLFQKRVTFPLTSHTEG